MAFQLATIYGIANVAQPNLERRRFAQWCPSSGCALRKQMVQRSQSPRVEGINSDLFTCVRVLALGVSRLFSAFGARDVMGGTRSFEHI